MKKRVFSLVLSLILIVSMLSGFALAADLPFRDVSGNQWYYNDVKNAYEMGLINGKTETRFCPNDNLTYAEAAKLAACMHQKYTYGRVSLENGDPWYQTYVDYCYDKGIISHDYDWNRNATRAGYMEIFAYALPDRALKAINKVPDGSIPDVTMNHASAAEIYKLYRAGILQGNDEFHSCNPSSPIRRSEVAAILTRMMDADKRIRFSMDAEALRIVTQPVDATVKEGSNFRLLVEVKGGVPPYTYEWAYLTLGGYWDTDIDHMYRTGSLGEPYLDLIASSFNYMMGRPFRCTITDDAGQKVQTDGAIISIEQADPLEITRQPYSSSGNQDEWDYLTVEVTGGRQPYEYQWQFLNGSSWYDIGTEYADNCNSPTMDIIYDVDSYLINRPIRCVITDADGNEIVTDQVQISVNAAPMRILTNVGGIETTYAVDLSHTIEITGGSGPYTYSWYYWDANANYWFFLQEQVTASQSNTVTIPDVSYFLYNNGEELYNQELQQGQFEDIISTYISCTIEDKFGNTVSTDNIQVFEIISYG